MHAGWCCMKDDCMSTIEPLEAVTEPWDGRSAAAERIYAQRPLGPIVPSGSIAGLL